MKEVIILITALILLYRDVNTMLSKKQYKFSTKNKLFGNLSTECKRHYELPYRKVNLTTLRIPLWNNDDEAFVNPKGFGCLETEYFMIADRFTLEVPLFLSNCRGGEYELRLILRDPDGNFLVKALKTRTSKQWNVFNVELPTERKHIRYKALIKSHTKNCTFIIKHIQIRSGEKHNTMKKSRRKRHVMSLNRWAQGRMRDKFNFNIRYAPRNLMLNIKSNALARNPMINGAFADSNRKPPDLSAVTMFPTPRPVLQTSDFVKSAPATDTFIQSTLPSVITSEETLTEAPTPLSGIPELIKDESITRPATQTPTSIEHSTKCAKQICFCDIGTVGPGNTTSASFSRNIIELIKHPTKQLVSTNLTEIQKEILNVIKTKLHLKDNNISVSPQLVTDKVVNNGKDITIAKDAELDIKEDTKEFKQSEDILNVSAVTSSEKKWQQATDKDKKIDTTVKNDGVFDISKEKESAAKQEQSKKKKDYAIKKEGEDMFDISTPITLNDQQKQYDITKGLNIQDSHQSHEKKMDQQKRTNTTGEEQTSGIKQSSDAIKKNITKKPDHKKDEIDTGISTVKAPNQERKDTEINETSTSDDVLVSHQSEVMGTITPDLSHHKEIIIDQEGETDKEAKNTDIKDDWKALLKKNKMKDITKHKGTKETSNATEAISVDEKREHAGIGTEIESQDQTTKSTVDSNTRHVSELDQKTKYKESMEVPDASTTVSLDTEEKQTEVKKVQDLSHKKNVSISEGKQNDMKIDSEEVTEQTYTQTKSSSKDNYEDLLTKNNATTKLELTKDSTTYEDGRKTSDVYTAVTSEKEGQQMAVKKGTKSQDRKKTDVAIDSVNKKNISEILKDAYDIEQQYTKAKNDSKQHDWDSLKKNKTYIKKHEDAEKYKKKEKLSDLSTMDDEMTQVDTKKKTKLDSKQFSHKKKVIVDENENIDTLIDNQEKQKTETSKEEVYDPSQQTTQIVTDFTEQKHREIKQDSKESDLESLKKHHKDIQSHNQTDEVSNVTSATISVEKGKQTESKKGDISKGKHIPHKKKVATGKGQETGTKVDSEEIDETEDSKEQAKNAEQKHREISQDSTEGHWDSVKKDNIPAELHHKDIPTHNQSDEVSNVTSTTISVEKGNQTKTKNGAISKGKHIPHKKKVATGEGQEIDSEVDNEEVDKTEGSKEEAKNAEHEHRVIKQGSKEGHWDLVKKDNVPAELHHKDIQGHNQSDDVSNVTSTTTSVAKGKQTETKKGAISKGKHIPHKKKVSTNEGQEIGTEVGNEDTDETEGSEEEAKNAEQKHKEIEQDSKEGHWDWGKEDNVTPEPHHKDIQGHNQSHEVSNVTSTTTSVEKGKQTETNKGAISKGKHIPPKKKVSTDEGQEMGTEVGNEEKDETEGSEEEAKNAEQKHKEIEQGSKESHWDWGKEDNVTPEPHHKDIQGHNQSDEVSNVTSTTISVEKGKQTETKKGAISKGKHIPHKKKVSTGEGQEIGTEVGHEEMDETKGSEEEAKNAEQKHKEIEQDSKEGHWDWGKEDNVTPETHHKDIQGHNQSDEVSNFTSTTISVEKGKQTETKKGAISKGKHIPHKKKVSTGEGQEIGTEVGHEEMDETKGSEEEAKNAEQKHKEIEQDSKEGHWDWGKEDNVTPEPHHKDIQGHNQSDDVSNVTSTTTSVEKGKQTETKKGAISKGKHIPHKKKVSTDEGQEIGSEVGNEETDETEGSEEEAKNAEQKHKEIEQDSKEGNWDWVKEDNVTPEPPHKDIQGHNQSDEVSNVTSTTISVEKGKQTETKKGAISKGKHIPHKKKVSTGEGQEIGTEVGHEEMDETKGSEEEAKNAEQKHKEIEQDSKEGHWDWGKEDNVTPETHHKDIQGHNQSDEVSNFTSTTISVEKGKQTETKKGAISKGKHIPHKKKVSTGEGQEIGTEVGHEEMDETKGSEEEAKNAEQKHKEIEQDSKEGHWDWGKEDNVTPEPHHKDIQGHNQSDDVSNVTSTTTSVEKGKQTETKKGAISKGKHIPHKKKVSTDEGQEIGSEVGNEETDETEGSEEEAKNAEQKHKEIEQDSKEGNWDWVKEDNVTPEPPHKDIQGHNQSDDVSNVTSTTTSVEKGKQTETKKGAISKGKHIPHKKKVSTGEGQEIGTEVGHEEMDETKGSEEEAKNAEQKHKEIEQDSKEGHWDWGKEDNVTPEPHHKDIQGHNQSDDVSNVTSTTTSVEKGKQTETKKGAISKGKHIPHKKKVSTDEGQEIRSEVGNEETDETEGSEEEAKNAEQKHKEIEQDSKEGNWDWVKEDNVTPEPPHKDIQGHNQSDDVSNVTSTTTSVEKGKQKETKKGAILKGKHIPHKKKVSTGEGQEIGTEVGNEETNETEGSEEEAKNAEQKHKEIEQDSKEGHWDWGKEDNVTPEPHHKDIQGHNQSDEVSNVTSATISVEKGKQTETKKGAILKGKHIPHKKKVSAGEGQEIGTEVGNEEMDESEGSEEEAKNAEQKHKEIEQDSKEGHWDWVKEDNVASEPHHKDIQGHTQSDEASNLTSTTISVEKGIQTETKEGALLKGKHIPHKKKVATGEGQEIDTEVDNEEVDETKGSKEDAKKAEQEHREIKQDPKEGHWDLVKQDNITAEPHHKDIQRHNQTDEGSNVTSTTTSVEKGKQTETKKGAISKGKHISSKKKVATGKGQETGSEVDSEEIDETEDSEKEIENVEQKHTEIKNNSKEGHWGSLKKDNITAKKSNIKHKDEVSNVSATVILDKEDKQTKSTKENVLKDKHVSNKKKVATVESKETDVGIDSQEKGETKDTEQKHTEIESSTKKGYWNLLKKDKVTPKLDHKKDITKHKESIKVSKVSTSVISDKEEKQSGTKKGRQNFSHKKKFVSDKNAKTDTEIDTEKQSEMELSKDKVHDSGIKSDSKEDYWDLLQKANETAKIGKHKESEEIFDLSTIAVSDKEGKQTETKNGTKFNDRHSSHKQATTSESEETATKTDSEEEKYSEIKSDSKEKKWGSLKEYNATVKVGRDGDAKKHKEGAGSSIVTTKKKKRKGTKKATNLQDLDLLHKKNVSAVDVKGKPTDNKDTHTTEVFEHFVSGENVTMDVDRKQEVTEHDHKKDITRNKENQDKKYSHEKQKEAEITKISNTQDLQEEHKKTPAVDRNKEMSITIDKQYKHPSTSSQEGVSSAKKEHPEVKYEDALQKNTDQSEDITKHEKDEEILGVSTTTISHEENESAEANKGSKLDWHLSHEKKTIADKDQEIDALAEENVSKITKEGASHTEQEHTGTKNDSKKNYFDLLKEKNVSIFLGQESGSGKHKQGQKMSNVSTLVFSKKKDNQSGLKEFPSKDEHLSHKTVIDEIKETTVDYEDNPVSELSNEEVSDKEQKHTKTEKDSGKDYLDTLKEKKVIADTNQNKNIAKYNESKEIISDKEIKRNGTRNETKSHVKKITPDENKEVITSGNQDKQKEEVYKMEPKTPAIKNDSEIDYWNFMKRKNVSMGLEQKKDVDKHKEYEDIPTVTVSDQKQTKSEINKDLDSEDWYLSHKEKVATAHGDKETDMEIHDETKHIWEDSKAKASDKKHITKTKNDSKVDSSDSIKNDRNFPRKQKISTIFDHKKDIIGHKKIKGTSDMSMTDQKGIENKKGHNKKVSSDEDVEMISGTDWNLSEAMKDAVNLTHEININEYKEYVRKPNKTMGIVINVNQNKSGAAEVESTIASTTETSFQFPVGYFSNGTGKPSFISKDKYWWAAFSFLAGSGTTTSLSPKHSSNGTNSTRPASFLPFLVDLEKAISESKVQLKSNTSVPKSTSPPDISIRMRPVVVTVQYFPYNLFANTNRTSNKSSHGKSVTITPTLSELLYGQIKAGSSVEKDAKQTATVAKTLFYNKEKGIQSATVASVINYVNKSAHGKEYFDHVTEKGDKHAQEVTKTPAVDESRYVDMVTAPLKNYFTKIAQNKNLGRTNFNEGFIQSSTGKPNIKQLTSDSLQTTLPLRMATASSFSKKPLKVIKPLFSIKAAMSPSHITTDEYPNKPGIKLTTIPDYLNYSNKPIVQTENAMGSHTLDDSSFGTSNIKILQPPVGSSEQEYSGKNIAILETTVKNLEILDSTKHTTIYEEVKRIGTTSDSQASSTKNTKPLKWLIKYRLSSPAIDINAPTLLTAAPTNLETLDSKKKTESGGHTLAKVNEEAFVTTELYLPILKGKIMTSTTTSASRTTSASNETLLNSEEAIADSNQNKTKSSRKEPDLPKLFSSKTITTNAKLKMFTPPPVFISETYWATLPTNNSNMEEDSFETKEVHAGGGDQEPSKSSRKPSEFLTPHLVTLQEEDGYSPTLDQNSTKVTVKRNTESTVSSTIPHNDSLDLNEVFKDLNHDKKIFSELETPHSHYSSPHTAKPVHLLITTAMSSEHSGKRLENAVSRRKIYLVKGASVIPNLNETSTSKSGEEAKESFIHVSKSPTSTLTTTNNVLGTTSPNVIETTPASLNVSPVIESSTTSIEETAWNKDKVAAFAGKNKEALGDAADEKLATSAPPITPTISDQRTPYMPLETSSKGLKETMGKDIKPTISTNANIDGGSSEIGFPEQTTEIDADVTKLYPPTTTGNLDGLESNVVKITLHKVKSKVHYAEASDQLINSTVSPDLSDARPNKTHENLNKMTTGRRISTTPSSINGSSHLNEEVSETLVTFTESSEATVNETLEDSNISSSSKAISKLAKTTSSDLTSTTEKINVTKDSSKSASDIKNIKSKDFSADKVTSASVDEVFTVPAWNKEKTKLKKSKPILIFTKKVKLIPTTSENLLEESTTPCVTVLPNTGKSIPFALLIAIIVLVILIIFAFLVFWQFSN